MNTEAAASRDAGLMDILMDIGVEQPYKDVAKQAHRARRANATRWRYAVTAMQVLKRLRLRQ